MARTVPITDDRYTERLAIFQDIFVERSVQSAAEQLAAISLAKGSLEAGLGGTWGSIIAAAREFPEHQHHLVNLLVALTQLPPALDSQGQPLMLYDRRVWADLPMLGWDFNYEWNCYNASDARPGRRDRAAAFVNVNSFAARLAVTGNPAFDYSMFAIWTMRPALEEDRTDQLSSVAPPDVFVPAAAQWIALAGPEMYRWDKDFAKESQGRGPGRGGPLWSGMQGFCEERWKLWKKRFVEVAKNIELAEDVRKEARQAAARMVEIETEEQSEAM